MAEPHLVSLTRPEIRALAERLFNRGISKMGTQHPSRRGTSASPPG
jgi:hypothetical protein